MENTLRVGVISSTHGVRGEVKVYPTTDDMKRFKKLKTVILDTGKEPVILEIEGVKFFKNMVSLKFKGYDSIIEDLIGLTVVTDAGEDCGVLTDVLQTGANDGYVIQDQQGKEYLFPAIPSCILNVDLEEGTVLVHILDGLLDL